MGIKCIHDCKDKKQIKSIYVFSDCDSAINTVVSISELNKYPDIHQKLHSLQHQLVTILSLLIWLTFQDIQAYLAALWLTEKLKTRHA